MSGCCIQCPYCGQPVDVIHGMEMLAGNEWTLLIQQLPNSMIGVLLRYLELFKPLKQELRWSRRLSLTQELVPMIKAAQVKRNGIVYAAPVPVWEAEMLKLAARPASVSFPLKSNGYLLAVLAAKGEQNAATLEKATEQQRQNRVVYAGSNNVLPPANHAENLMAEAERKRQERKPPPNDWKGAVGK
jgi:hypothetical protein